MSTTSVLAHGILKEVKFTCISWPPRWNWKDHWNGWHHCYPGKKQIKETPFSLWLPQKQTFSIPIPPGNSGQEQLRDMSTAKSHYYYYYHHYHVIIIIIIIVIIIITIIIIIIIIIIS